MKVKEIARALEEMAPVALQESYDNSGLIIGDAEAGVRGILLCVDVTSAILDEAVAKGCNLVVSHHPVIFSGQKRLTGDTPTQKLIVQAVKHDIAVYAAHTNADNAFGGVSFALGKRLGLTGMRVLSPRRDAICKLVVYAPEDYAEPVRNALFASGAGTIGAYDECSYTGHGSGTFRAGADTNPFVGRPGVRHTEPEARIECVVPDYRVPAVLAAVRKAHPYEEMAYDLLREAVPDYLSGAGVVGDIEPCELSDFLRRVKEVTGTGCLRRSPVVREQVSRIALCGGSGAGFIGDAVRSGADLYISADFKYHDFFDACGTITLADVGHYESEKFIIDVFYDLITKKFPTFVVYRTSLSSNPITYL